MIVTFSCPAYTNITMFGEVAVRLLKMMGHSGTVPSAILAEDVPAALERLETALAAEAKRHEHEPETEGDDGERPVSLQHRALPLVEMLKTAQKEARRVSWS